MLVPHDCTNMLHHRILLLRTGCRPKFSMPFFFFSRVNFFYTRSDSTIQKKKVWYCAVVLVAFAEYRQTYRTNFKIMMTSYNFFYKFV